MMDLFSYHHNWEEKRNGGIINIRKEKNRWNKSTYAIFIDRADGTQDDISYGECVTNLNNQNRNYYKEYFNESCRRAVEETIKNFRSENEKNGLLECSKCGDLKQYREIDTHHRPPNTFKSIVNLFIEKKDIDVNSIEYEEAIIGKKFKNEKMAQNFREFHDKKMDLVLLCKKCHSNSKI